MGEAVDKFGQLCTGHQRLPRTYSVPRFIKIRARISEIASGDHHLLLLSEGGRVFSAGSNKEGQLGVGGSLEKSSRPVLIKTLSSKTCRKVFAGGFSSFCTTDSKEFFAWGSNDNGQLFKASAQRVDVPELIESKSHGLPSRIVSNQRVSVGIFNGEIIVSKGINPEVQEDNVFEGMGLFARDIALGFGKSPVFLYVERENGTVQRVNPEEKTTETVMASCKGRQVAIGNGFELILDSENSVHVLGRFNGENYKEPTPLFRNVASAQAGSDFIVLKDSNYKRFRVVGENSKGQLGIPTVSSLKEEEPIPQLDDQPIHQYAVGPDYCMAISYKIKPRVDLEECSQFNQSMHSVEENPKNSFEINVARMSRTLNPETNDQIDHRNGWVSTPHKLLRDSHERDHLGRTNNPAPLEPREMSLMENPKGIIGGKAQEEYLSQDHPDFHDDHIQNGDFDGGNQHEELRNQEKTPSFNQSEFLSKRCSPKMQSGRQKQQTQGPKNQSQTSSEQSNHTFRPNFPKLNPFENQMSSARSQGMNSLSLDKDNGANPSFMSHDATSGLRRLLSPKVETNGDPERFQRQNQPFRKATDRYPETQKPIEGQWGQPQMTPETQRFAPNPNSIETEQGLPNSTKAPTSHWRNDQIPQSKAVFSNPKHGASLPRPFETNEKGEMDLKRQFPTFGPEEEEKSLKKTPTKAMLFNLVVLYERMRQRYISILREARDSEAPLPLKDPDHSDLAE